MIARPPPPPFPPGPPPPILPRCPQPACPDRYTLGWAPSTGVLAGLVVWLDSFVDPHHTCVCVCAGSRVVWHACRQAHAALVHRQEQWVLAVVSAGMRSRVWQARSSTKGGDGAAPIGSHVPHIHSLGPADNSQSLHHISISSHNLAPARAMTNASFSNHLSDNPILPLAARSRPAPVASGFVTADVHVPDPESDDDAVNTSFARFPIAPIAVPVAMVAGCPWPLLALDSERTHQSSAPAPLDRNPHALQWLGVHTKNGVLRSITRQ